jgi:hypothetical protein
MKEMPEKAEELANNFHLESFQKGMNAKYHEGEGWKFS